MLLLLLEIIYITGHRARRYVGESDAAAKNAGKVFRGSVIAK